MPVRWAIQSSVVSTTRATSALLRMREGMAEPVPAIWTPIRGMAGKGRWLWPLGFMRSLRW